MKNKRVSFFIITFLYLIPCEAVCSVDLVYISSSTGNDSNKGTEENPLKTIRAGKKTGASDILLKAGDVFYENVTLDGVNLRKYGVGNNPIICGYKRIKKPSQWESVSENIWRISLAEGDYSGIDYKGSLPYNNIGCIHEYDNDVIHGRRVRILDNLKEDWDFWQSSDYKSKNYGNFDNLYLYFSGDPRELKLEFSTGVIGITVKNACIENINVEGFAIHGISPQSNSIIKNCRVDAIGGELFLGFKTFVCLGNGIEVYVGEDVENCLVEGCYISRCYDCGCSIQGSNRGTATPRNIIFRDNLITNCCQWWEDFLCNDDNVKYENCVFENNVIVGCGNSGFGYADGRFKYCNVLGNNVNGDKGMIIRRNLFVGGNFYCSGAYEGGYRSNLWEDNTFISNRGNWLLSNYNGTRDITMIPQDKGKFKSIREATKDAIGYYREKTGDSTTTFIVKSQRTVSRRGRKAIAAYLKKHNDIGFVSK